MVAEQVLLSPGEPLAPRYRRITAEERHALIAKVAYGLAEQRGFAPGREAEDWARAEELVEQSLEGDCYCGD